MILWITFGLNDDLSGDDLTSIKLTHDIFLNTASLLCQNARAASVKLMTIEKKKSNELQWKYLPK